MEAVKESRQVKPAEVSNFLKEALNVFRKFVAH